MNDMNATMCSVDSPVTFKDLPMEGKFRIYRSDRVRIGRKVSGSTFVLDDDSRSGEMSIDPDLTIAPASESWIKDNMYIEKHECNIDESHETRFFPE